nr:biosynthetic-type acetolactate synthase large subunit [Schwartzia sp. (in: firmicutes)]
SSDTCDEICRAGSGRGKHNAHLSRNARGTVRRVHCPLLTKHEQGAVHAADGYARVTGKVGVVFATSGPGATNLVTGIATANMDSIPLVCFTGQVGNPYIGKDSFQEADVSGIVTPITKYNYLVKNVEDLPRVIKEAFFLAATGRPGPVVIDIAKDVFAAEFDYKYPEAVHLPGYSGDFTGSPAQIEEFICALEEAERPLFFLGGGVTLSNMTEEMRSIIKRTGAPVVSSLMALGCADPADEAAFGMAGMHGCYAANMAIQECDLLIGVGVRFDDRVTSLVEEFAPKAKIAHFDVDAAEINKNVRVDYPVLGDLRWSLPILRRRLDSIKTDFAGRVKAWREHTIQMNKEKPFAYESVPGSVMPEKAIEEVSRLATDDTIVVTDVGQHQMWAAQFYSARRPRQFVTSGGLGTMGYGLPAAIGAKLGKPEQQVVLFTGDGSIMMNCQEFATAADYGVDVKVVILHNHVLGMVAQWQRLFYNKHLSESRLNGHTDFVKLAEAMGVSAARVEKPEELAPALEKLMAHKGPMVLDVLVPEAEDVLPMVPGGKRLDQMVMGGTEG